MLNIAFIGADTTGFLSAGPFHEAELLYVLLNTTVFFLFDIKIHISFQTRQKIKKIYISAQDMVFKLDGYLFKTTAVQMAVQEFLGFPGEKI